jgi:hypothetical protein
MVYRDELQAAQERIAALEAELAEARRKLDHAEGRSSVALVVAGKQSLAVVGRPSAAARWLGAPTQLGAERSFDGELSTSGAWPEILETCQRVTGEIPREVSAVDGYLTCSWGARQVAVTLTVTSRDGRTTLRLQQNLRQLAGATFGGVGGGLGGGALAGPIALCTLMPAAAPVIIGGWFAGVYGVCRWVFRRQVRKQAAHIQALYEELGSLIERRIAR